MNRFMFGIVMSIGLVTGCSSLPSETGSGEPGVTQPRDQQLLGATESTEPQLFLVEPLPADPNLEIELLQLTEILFSSDLDDEQKAQVLQRRSVVYDFLGLKTLALVDVNQALELKPDLVEGYHSLGIYYAERGEYAGAFEAFDSVIELKPNHDYVYLNRGLAAYYNGQYSLAMSDFADHYFQDTSDPFRVMWYYFAAKEVDSGRAEEQIREQWQDADGDSWGQAILAFLVGEKSSEDLIHTAFAGSEDQQQLNYRLCEAYFYMGKVAAMNSQNYAALNYFKLTLSTNVYAYLEHRYARSEILRLREAIRAEEG